MSALGRSVFAWVTSLLVTGLSGLGAKGTLLQTRSSRGQFSVSVCSLLPPVPRLLFEDWTYDDFRSVLDSEDEIEELSKTVVQVAKVRPVCCSGPQGSDKA